MYRSDDDGDWRVKTTDYPVSFLFWNENPSLTVPDDSNLKYGDPNFQRFFVDPQLKVTKGALKPCPGVKIYGLGPVVKKQNTKLGIFKVKEKMFNGHPLYQNNNGEVLHMANDGYWTVGPLGEYGIRGLPGSLCPNEATKWEYYDGYENQPAEILVKSL